MFIKADKQQRIQAQNVKKAKSRGNCDSPSVLFFFCFLNNKTSINLLRQYKLYFHLFLLKHMA